MCEKFSLQQGAQIEDETSRNGTTSIYLDETPHAVRDAMGYNGVDGLMKAGFSLPVKTSVVYLHRTQPAVQGLAGYVLDSALDEQMAVRALARRCGAVRSRAVFARPHYCCCASGSESKLVVRTTPRKLLAEDWQLVAFRFQHEVD